MKKFLTLLLALTVALSMLAISVNAEEVVGDVDLLAASGYGNPAYLYEEGIAVNSSEWDSHCNWQLHQGYLGFLGESGTPTVFATRDIVETTLSNGETGYALHAKNTAGQSCFLYTTLENMDLLCGGFEQGQKYRVVVVAKVMEGPFDVIPSISINGFEAVQMAIDSQWHTYTVDFVYDAADATADSTRSHENWNGYCDGAYKDTYAITLHLNNIGFTYADTEFFYESIQVFEVNEQPVTGDSMILFAVMFTVAVAASLALSKKKAF